MSRGLRFAFTEDQRALAAGVRSALQELCPPEVVRQGWRGPVEDLERGLAELGLFELAIPEEDDGLGLGPLDMVLVYEELGRACVPGPVAEGMVLAPVLQAAGEGAASRLREGRARVSVHRDGEPCPHATQGAWLFELPREGLFAYESAEISPLEGVDGSRHLAWVRGELRPVPADADALHDHLVLATAAQLLGLARHMLDVTVAYAKVREQFGTPIGSQQAVQHHLADALLALRFAAPVVYQAAWSVHHAATWRGLHVAMAKVKASEAAELVGRVALQVHGAIAYTTEYDLHLWLKRTWALARAWGSVREHLDTIAVALLEDPPSAPVDGIDLGAPRG